LIKYKTIYFCPYLQPAQKTTHKIFTRKYIRPNLLLLMYELNFITFGYRCCCNCDL